MDPQTRNFQQPPLPTKTSSSTHSPDASFPIIAIAVIGILATAFLLVSYYVFVIKCCLNWHRIDLLGRFSFSLSSHRRRRRSGHGSALDDQSFLYSPSAATAAADRRGLDESVIRALPICQFRKSGSGARDSLECAVCLNEFQEMEKLRSLPGCGHLFHIDCIDVWLQSNANCPLCRTSISHETARFGFGFHRIAAPAPSPQDPSPYPHSRTSNGDEDFVVIELGDHNLSTPANPSPPSLFRNRETLRSRDSMSPLRIKRKARRKWEHVLSMGDECIEIDRVKDANFLVVQPMRRSFSLDSSNDPLFYKCIQEIVQQKGNVNGNEAVPCAEVGSSSSRVRRSLFSFGHGRGSRSAVLPINLDP